MWRLGKRTEQEGQRAGATRKRGEEKGPGTRRVGRQGEGQGGRAALSARLAQAYPTGQPALLPGSLPHPGRPQEGPEAQASPKVASAWAWHGEGVIPHVWMARGLTSHSLSPGP